MGKTEVAIFAYYDVAQDLNLDYEGATTHNFSHLGCVFNVAWSQYNIPSLCNEVTKQANVQFYAWVHSEPLPRRLIIHIAIATESSANKPTIAVFSA